jgi:1-phosphofructokinase
MAAITRGSEGAVLVAEMGAWLAHLKVPNPVSTVGSGDAFVAGFIAGLQGAVKAGESTSITTAAARADVIVQAFTLAVACGAANTLLLGAGIIKDVEHFRRVVDVRALE